MAYKNLPANQVTDFLSNDGVTVLDMRDEHSFKSGHLDGSLTASDANMKSLIKSGKHDLPILIYCYHGNSSRDLASFFVALGFSQVYNLEGGWEAWKKYQQLETLIIQNNDINRWIQKHGFDANNLNNRIENGMSPIMTAVIEGNIKTLQILIENNVDLNLLNDDENNALWFACFKEDMTSIDILIKHGINIDHQNINAATALIYAASAGKYTVVKALITAGADINKATLDGFNALDSAATLPILKLLKPLTAAA